MRNPSIHRVIADVLKQRNDMGKILRYFVFRKTSGKLSRTFSGGLGRRSDDKGGAGGAWLQQ